MSTSLSSINSNPVNSTADKPNPFKSSSEEGTLYGGGHPEGEPRTKESTLPPMLLQYVDYKQTYPDKIIFFQVGDFYEVFFEDAVTVSNLLNLTLTSRDKNNPNPVPMCGVPVHAVDGFIERLVSHGHSVAVVSQLNASSSIRLPSVMKQEGGASKVVIHRKLTRIVTPGIRLLSPSDEGGVEHVVASVIVESELEAALAYSHAQSGIIFVKESLNLDELISEIAKRDPVELILPAQWRGKKVDRRTHWVKRLERAVSDAAFRFRVPAEEERNRAQSGNLDSATGRPFTYITGFSALGETARRAVRALCYYFDETTLDSRLRVDEVRAADDALLVSIDRTTSDNLELVENRRDRGTYGTLFSTLNHCVSLGGARLLRRWILQPLRQVDMIEERLDSVAYFKNNPEVRLRVREILRGVSDLERIAARIELSNVSPRELAALRDSWCAVEKLKQLCDSADAPALVARIRDDLSVPELQKLRLESALADCPAAVLGEGEVIHKGYSSELDRLRDIKSSGSSWVEEYEARERIATGIQSLKVKFNYVLGYFIEITRANLSKVPANYHRRQSTANAERYTTDDLRVREQEILGADEKAVELETSLYRELVQDMQPATSGMRLFHRHLSALDVLAGLAEVAEREGYVCPTVDLSRRLNIELGLHPVLHQLLSGRCIANSLDLGGTPTDPRPLFLIVTGPNMGGKSTYLRQAALIVIMAQLGSFVPARSAHIGVVDRVYARLGASDNIAEGESTFMVEMREASHILSGASDRSLVLIDEIGRGTATADGLAIAQAILEWIVQKIRCRTLFATHFHELTELAAQYSEIGNVSVHSIERGDDVHFTHEIRVGPASKSYGIQVARLAGLPPAVLLRAQELMPHTLKAKAVVMTQRASFQMGLFERMQEPQDYAELKSVKKRIEAVDIDGTTPFEALSLLKDLKDELT